MKHGRNTERRRANSVLGNFFRVRSVFEPWLIGSVQTELIMARVTFQWPECRAPISLSGPVESGDDIKCPECGAWVAIPSHLRGAESRREVPSSGEGGSNAALWIGLAIGGGFLLLLLGGGGIWAVLWLLRGQPPPVPVKGGTVARKTAPPAQCS